ncbi:MAG TPA: hypothetical protein DE036_10560 [Actinobacteria bacterium]|nr:hypothetical protein [Actinomycetota bacterium]
MSKPVNIVAVIVTALVFGGGGFYGGMTYQKSQTPAFAQNGGQFGAGRGPGQGVPGAGMRGAVGGDGQSRPVAGEIIEQDDNSITVKLPDGSSKIVMLSSKTKINKSASGVVSDLKKGEQVMALGTEGSDGTLVAETVSLGRFGFGMSGQPTQTQSQSK